MSDQMTPLAATLPQYSSSWWKVLRRFGLDSTDTGLESPLPTIIVGEDTSWVPKYLSLLAEAEVTNCIQRFRNSPWHKGDHVLRTTFYHTAAGEFVTVAVGSTFSGPFKPVALVYGPDMA